ncbi:hypothetical protein D9M68_715130 [compost metagenome]
MTIANVLKADDGEAVEPQAGIERQVQHKTRLCAGAVFGLVLAHLVDRPSVKAVAGVQKLDLRGRVHLREIAFDGPRE